MILKYGTYTHDLGSVGLVVNVESLRTEADEKWATRHRWTIDGRLTSRKEESLARLEIKDKCDDLQDAYRYDGKDAILYFPDGITKSHHVLNSQAAIGGVRVVQPPSFPTSAGVEGVTMRRFQIVLEAIYPVASSQLSTLCKSFTEQLEFGPVGARAGHIETLIGLPQKQRLRLYQTCRVRQVGQAIGLYAYPPVPNPIWPQHVVNGWNPPFYGHPKRIGTELVDWPVSWTYDFESALPLSAKPNIWGITYTY